MLDCAYLLLLDDHAVVWITRATTDASAPADFVMFTYINFVESARKARQLAITSFIGVKTWSTGGYFWPKNFLSVDLENARTITWGYDAHIANAFRPASSESIHGKAETLLHDLDMERDDITRPIIFVCHSLGGLVAKEALSTAAKYYKHDRHSNLGAIYANTKELIFLSTPCRGSEMASLEKVLANIASPHRLNKRLLRSFQKDISNSRKTT